MSQPRPGLLIAIDGPAGAGKSTAARCLARQLGGSLLDTGAIYRTLALISDRRSIDWADESALVGLAEDFPLEFRPAERDGDPQQVLFAGEPITTQIRTPHISDGASRVSALPGVRAALLEIQRAIAATSVEAGRACVAEGRDMGSVVFPNADYKFFLTASVDARARRRHSELLSRGVDTTLEAVRAEMSERDERDSSRAAAPLVRAVGAVLLDSSELDIEGVMAALNSAIGDTAG